MAVIGGSRRSVFAAAVVAGLALLVSLIDPMGLDEASDRRSVQAVDRVLALYYAPEPTGRSLVTTVSVSEASLNAVGREWPPQYGFYAEVLETLAGDATAMPSVIFIDYTFLTELHDRRQRDQFVTAVGQVTRADAWASNLDCASDPLAKIGCIRQAGGTPIIIGKPYPTDRCEATPTVVMLDRVAVLAPIGWPGFVDGWSPVLTRAAYRAGAPDGCQAIEGISGPDARPSPMEMMIEGEAGPQVVIHRYPGVARYDLAPAAAMLAALCSDRRTSVVKPAACRSLSGEGGALALPAAWSEPVLSKVIWGSRPDPAWLANEKAVFGAEEDVARFQTCERENAEGARKLWRTLEVGAAVFFSRLTEDGAAAAIGCPYHPDFGYERFIAGAAPGGHAPDDLASKFIAGRAVIVGSSLRYGGDWVDTVTRGRAPGMSTHAMMFDNLVEQAVGSHSPPVLFRWMAMDLDWGEVLEVLVAFMVAFGVKHVALSTELPIPQDVGYEGALRRRAAFFIGLLVFAIPIFVGVATVVTHYWRWTPVNIQALFGLIVIQVLIEFRDVWRGLFGVAWRAMRNIPGPAARLRPEQATAEKGNGL